jgi:hypothetical protein
MNARVIRTASLAFALLALSATATLNFGEVRMNDDNRRVTTVRFDMGSKFGAHAAGPEGEPNGTWGR